MEQSNNEETKKRIKGIRDKWMMNHDIQVNDEKNEEENRNPFYYCHDRLYHYTSLESFWKIVEGDFLRAFNVRFSNDTEEYQLGKKNIEKLSEKDTNIVIYEKDCYMICFCKEDNLLSQWREYAEGGVAIGFDFSRDCIFTILNNDKTILENSDKLKNGQDGLTEDTKCYYSPGRDRHQGFLYMYSQPISVIYVKGVNGEIENKKITFNDIKMVIDKKAKDDGLEEKQVNMLLNKLIPYIKHADFCEEKEARMIFNLYLYYRPYKVCYLDSKGLKKPYIKIAYGDQTERIYDCQYLLMSEHISENLKQDIYEYCKTKNLKVEEIVEEKNEKEEFKQCRIIVSNGLNQKEIFSEIQNFVEEPKHKSNDKNKNIRIWCDGHLPIRTIKIGPSYNISFIKESIEHYKKSLYWLYYVDVLESETPYRSKK